mmetsp:Transcript_33442/g.62170  ORF Transcript_33442/g.62170 Transcript_33442/m.62170 type:complete len:214 (-) Transcript_33442:245-886(-)
MSSSGFRSFSVNLGMLSSVACFTCIPETFRRSMNLGHSYTSSFSVACEKYTRFSAEMMASVPGLTILSSKHAKASVSTGSYTTSLPNTTSTPRSSSSEISANLRAVFRSSLGFCADRIFGKELTSTSLNLSSSPDGGSRRCSGGCSQSSCRMATTPEGPEDSEVLRFPEEGGEPDEVFSNFVFISFASDVADAELPLTLILTFSSAFRRMLSS